MYQRITVDMECPYCGKINSVRLISVDIHRNLIENRLELIEIIPSSLSTGSFSFYKCYECKIMFKNVYDKQSILSISEFFSLF